MFEKTKTKINKEPQNNIDNLLLNNSRSPKIINSFQAIKILQRHYHENIEKKIKPHALNYLPNYNNKKNTSLINTLPINNSPEKKSNLPLEQPNPNKNKNSILKYKDPKKAESSKEENNQLIDVIHNEDGTWQHNPYGVQQSIKTATLPKFMEDLNKRSIKQNSIKLKKH